MEKMMVGLLNILVMSAIATNQLEPALNHFEEFSDRKGLIKYEMLSAKHKYRTGRAPLTFENVIVKRSCNLIAVLNFLTPVEFQKKVPCRLMLEKTIKLYKTRVLQQDFCEFFFNDDNTLILAVIDSSFNDAFVEFIRPTNKNLFQNYKAVQNGEMDKLSNTPNLKIQLKKKAYVMSNYHRATRHAQMFFITVFLQMFYVCQVFDEIFHWLNFGIFFTFTMQHFGWFVDNLMPCMKRERDNYHYFFWAVILLPLLSPSELQAIVIPVASVIFHIVQLSLALKWTHDYDRFYKLCFQKPEPKICLFKYFASIIFGLCLGYKASSSLNKREQNASRSQTDNLSLQDDIIPLTGLMYFVSFWIILPKIHKYLR